MGNEGWRCHGKKGEVNIIFGHIFMRYNPISKKCLIALCNIRVFKLMNLAYFKRPSLYH